MEDKKPNKNFNTWAELFKFQAEKDGANYQMLKDWLNENFEVPKLKLIDIVIEGVTITKMRAVRLLDDKEFTVIIPNPKLGLYKSFKILSENSLDVNKFVEKDIVDLNPTRFTYL